MEMELERDWLSEGYCKGGTGRIGAHEEEVWDQNCASECGHYGPQTSKYTSFQPHRAIPMISFVRGKTRYADPQDVDEDFNHDNDRHPAPGPASDDVCPSTLYAELIARPGEEPDVSILNDNDISILPTRKRRRRPCERPQRTPLGSSATAASSLTGDQNDRIEENERPYYKMVLSERKAVEPCVTLISASASSPVIFVVDEDDSEKETSGHATISAFDCLVCGERVTSTDRATHERSTLHTFNAKKRVSCRRIMLPESNRGVQLLARLGWKEDTGLGKHAQGSVQPVKSILKLDRTCLGHQPLPPARVTHFPSHDAGQAARARDGKSRAQRKVEEVERRVHEGRAAAREGFVLSKKGERCETARGRRRRLEKEKESWSRISAALNQE